MSDNTTYQLAIEFVRKAIGDTVDEELQQLQVLGILREIDDLSCQLDKELIKAKEGIGREAEKANDPLFIPMRGWSELELATERLSSIATTEIKRKRE